MNDRVTLQLDDVTIQRAKDGTVTISPRRGARSLSTGLLIACGLVALLCGGGLAVNGVIQFFSHTGDNPIGFIIFGLSVTAMFGSMASHLLRQLQTVQHQKTIIISPITNTITTSQRVIDFTEVEDVAALVAPTDVVKLEDVHLARFTLALKNGEMIDLGNLAVEQTKMDERKQGIVTLLNQALKKV